MITAKKKRSLSDILSGLYYSGEGGLELETSTFLTFFNIKISLLAIYFPLLIIIVQIKYITEMRMA